MLKSDPRYDSCTKSKVKETFIRYRENDEDRRKREKDDDETMQVMIVRLKIVDKWQY